MITLQKKNARAKEFIDPGLILRLRCLEIWFPIIGGTASVVNEVSLSLVAKTGNFDFVNRYPRFCSMFSLKHKNLTSEILRVLIDEVFRTVFPQEVKATCANKTQNWHGTISNPNEGLKRPRC